MSFSGFPKGTLAFLAGLATHNEKAWFDGHREEYENDLITPAKQFVAALGPALQKVVSGIRAEPKVNGSIMRINRDTRFSKDKSPYKSHLDLWFWKGEEKSWSCPGFFFRLTPSTLTLGGGMHHLEDRLLNRYREAVAKDKTGALLDAAIEKVKQAGAQIGGEHYKKVPKGYPPDHPRAALLKHIGIFAWLDAPAPKELHSAAFIDYCVKGFAATAPIVGWVDKYITR